MGDMSFPFPSHEVPGKKSVVAAMVSVSKPIDGAHSGGCDHRTWSHQLSAGAGRLFAAALPRRNGTWRDLSMTEIRVDGARHLGYTLVTLDLVADN